MNDAPKVRGAPYEEISSPKIVDDAGAVQRIADVLAPEREVPRLARGLQREASVEDAVGVLPAVVIRRPVHLALLLEAHPQAQRIRPVADGRVRLEARGDLVVRGALQLVAGAAEVVERVVRVVEGARSDRAGSCPRGRR